MVTGVITRDSIRNALIKGITAEQIIYYMQSHAHSQMRKKVKCLHIAEKKKRETKNNNTRNNRYQFYH